MNRFRPFLILLAVMLAMYVLETDFGKVNNLSAVVGLASANILPAIGFTLVLACRQLDLSFATAMGMGGVLTLSLQPKLGWGGAVGVAIVAGLAMGLLNGLLVSKVKIHSFIATLGTMTVVGNLLQLYVKGGSVSSNEYAASDWVSDPIGKVKLLGLNTPIALLAIVLTIVFQIVLTRTRFGQNLLLVGGNPRVAWYAGVKSDRVTFSAFVISGVLAALQGSLMAIKDLSAKPQMADGSLMLVITATIIGGTSMKGGKGNVVGSAIAILTLAALTNGLSLKGAGTEARLIVSAALLGMIVLADAIAQRKTDLRKGERRDLLVKKPLAPTLETRI